MSGALRPRIGISGRTARVDGADRTGVNAAYVSSVARAGGLPLVLSPIIGPDAAPAIVAGLDGLLLTGGDDLDPGLYGAAPHAKLGPLDPPRDAFELALYHAATAARLPIFAICRGLQLVNVAEGGSLVQDLPSERPGPIRHAAGSPRDARTHSVTLTPDTLTAAACHSDTAEINTFHHQAVDRVAANLRVTGTAPDGTIEALERRDATAPWLVAVQWHPEELAHEVGSVDAALFATFVRVAQRD